MAIKVVIIGHGTICCSEECGKTWAHANGSGIGLAAYEVNRRSLPSRPTNLVLDLALGRLCCDQCGFNLEDLNAQESK